MGLEYIYAALLLHETSQEITEDSIAKVVQATGANPDKAMAKATAENLKDLDIEEVLKSAVVAPTVAPAQPQATEAEEKKEKKSEESEEDKEKKEEEAAEGLGSLFG